MNDEEIKKIIPSINYKTAYKIIKILIKYIMSWVVNYWSMWFHWFWVFSLNRKKSFILQPNWIQSKNMRIPEKYYVTFRSGKLFKWMHPKIEQQKNDTNIIRGKVI